MKIWLPGLLSVAVLAAPCAAQQLKVVKNAPFSATATTTLTQTLAGGNVVTRTTSTTLARDTEGRTRLEETRNNATGVFIHDPVAGVSWVLDPASRTARRFIVASATVDLTNSSSTAPPSGVPPDAARDSLGSDIVAGMGVEGTRLTRVLAAGEVGNDLPLTITTETWYSNELQTIVMSKTTDPRVGETIYKLTGVQRGQPDQTLFEIPAAYSVLDGASDPAPARKLSNSRR
jgi:hypothetical protein